MAKKEYKKNNSFPYLSLCKQMIAVKQSNCNYVKKLRLDNYTIIVTGLV